MKTVVFITGTNCAGKSTLARDLIRHYGGIKEEEETLTICADVRVTFAGTGYDVSSTNCGVDKIKNTRSLAKVVKQGMIRSDCVICEGSFLNTFGMNLTNALFCGEQALVVFLYANLSVINRRRVERSGKPLNGHIVQRQRGAVRAAVKWQDIGVPVLTIDTSTRTPEQIAEIVINKLHKYGL